MMLSVLLSSWTLCTVVSAFASPDKQRHHRTNFQFLPPGGASIATRLRAGGGDDFSDLTSALSRLDQQWQITERSKAKSRWSKLLLPRDGTNTPSGDDSNASVSPNDDDFVWVLEPPSNSIPSCVIVFTGGAGLGQFPHVAYNELLSRLSDRLNAVCIAAPYQVGLDHFGLAKQAGEKIRRALVYCEDDPSRLYPPSLPTYCLAHSLGCKLQTIYLAATGQQFEGIGYMSFNNFSFSQTISMARMFADQIRSTSRNDSGFKSPIDNDQLFNTIFAFAETVVGALGVDFTPNAKDTERLIQLRFDDVLQEKTRLFVFDEDTLDNSKEFVENCSGGRGPSVSGLPGGHLAPVFFKFGMDDLDLGDVPPEAIDMAKEAVGGFQSASFGNEAHLNELVQEICTWILGKPPKRPAQWDAKARNGAPQLVGSADEDGSKNAGA